MKQYDDALLKVLNEGVHSSDRTGTGTISTFGVKMEFDISEKFPAITTKKLMWKSVVSELLWFIEGSNDERRLCEILHGTRDDTKRTIWTDNANSPYWMPNAQFKGDLGRIYGTNWRSWPDGNGGSIDQLSELIAGIKKDPNGRRHILTAWNVADLNKAALPPCHVMAQFYVRDNTLSCQMYQRSADMFLGVPFNIASYALLTHMIAQVCGLSVGKLHHVIGDAHIYSNHVDQVRLQLSREHLELPILKINNPTSDIFQFTMSDFELVGYQHHPEIKAPMAV